jgi:hypothetical protein
MLSAALPFRSDRAGQWSEKPMRKTYEAWIDEQEQCITFGDLDNIQWHRSHGGLRPVAKLLHRIEADTPEEAHEVHHIRMGWEPYVPMGDAAPCPKGCGALYYPHGSGECPNCGPIGPR